jgi:hypothetical protein
LRRNPYLCDNCIQFAIGTLEETVFSIEITLLPSVDINVHYFYRDEPLVTTGVTTEIRSRLFDSSKRPLQKAKICNAMVLKIFLFPSKSSTSGKSNTFTYQEFQRQCTDIFRKICRFFTCYKKNSARSDVLIK